MGSGVAPITQYTHMSKKNSNTQGSSHNVVKVSLHILMNSSGSKFFPLKEDPILKMDFNLENHCLTVVSL